MALAILIILMSVISIGSNLLKSKRSVTFEKTLKENNHLALTKEKGFKRVGLAFIMLIFWTILMPMIGFFISTLVLTIILMYIIGNRNFVKMIIISSIFTFTLYAAAKYLLQLSI
ncbi:tripartite tricarboxylate transporter TctB family protein [Bacillus sp. N9]